MLRNILSYAVKAYNGRVGNRIIDVEYGSPILTTFSEYKILRHGGVAKYLPEIDLGDIPEMASSVNVLAGVEVRFTLAADKTINWGDGVTENFTTGQICAHTYAESGAYQITITTATPPTSANFQQSGAPNSIFHGTMVLDGSSMQALIFSSATTAHQFSNLSGFLLAGGGSRITNMDNTFSGCGALRIISLGDVSTVTSWISTFNACSSVEALLMSGAMESFDISPCTELNGDGVNNVFRNLGMVGAPGSDAKTITVAASTTGYNIDIATDLGWAVATA